MSGKGSRRRPLLIPAKDFGENWAKIFEKPKQTEERECYMQQKCQERK
jgi:hypothetical protein